MASQSFFYFKHRLENDFPSQARYPQMKAEYRGENTLSTNTKLWARFSKTARSRVGGQQKSEKGTGLLELGGEAARPSVCAALPNTQLKFISITSNYLRIRGWQCIAHSSRSHDSNHSASGDESDFSWVCQAVPCCLHRQHIR